MNFVTHESHFCRFDLHIHYNVYKYNYDSTLSLSVVNTANLIYTLMNSRPTTVIEVHNNYIELDH